MSIQLSFRSPYISIDSFNDTEIAGFSVITGLNGSGKTHLLKAINEGAIAVKNIEPAEIIYYSYNDFVIHDGDPSGNQLLQQKRDGYNSKNESFNSRIYNERMNALNAFDFSIKVGDARFSFESFYHIVNFEILSNWSKDDCDFYDAKIQEHKNAGNPNAFFQELRPNQIEFLQAIGTYHPIADIKLFLSTIKQFKAKVDAFHLIRNSGYSKKLLDWNVQELSTLSGIGNDIFENIWNNELRIKLSGGLALFIDALSNIPNPTSYHQIENLIALKKELWELFEEMEEHFIQTISPGTLNIIKGINGSDRILEHVTTESGFLNLHEISVAEKQYQFQKISNDFSEFQHSKGKPAHFLSEDDFFSTYGDSPVNILNKVLIEYDCNGYEFKQSELPSSFGIDISQQHIQVNLFNKKGGYYTNLDSLSSGERTLLALSFTIFKLRRRKVIAKLFLLDEVDSALHPSMAKRLLNVLYNLFHKELMINLIISTHSPSTVAFAPKDSIFVMKRDGDQRLSSTSRDRALSELTSGVPSFSINYENRRQVFVESQYDVQFYESLYNIYKGQLDSEISLNFISSGDTATNSNGIGISNCEQVQKITSILRQTGSRFAWGIVDWDLNTTKPAEEFVKVLGFESRYSMENYLLDPLLIGILLLREKFVEPTFFGFEETVRIFDILIFNASQLQQMIDTVLQKLVIENKNAQQSLRPYQIIDGTELSLPNWFCEHQGHKLEEKYLSAFPKLNEIKKKKEATLKQAVIDKVIADFPNLAPIDLLDILKQVQEV